MGRLGKVITSYVDKVPGTGLDAQFVAVEEYAGDERKAQVFGPCNEDFAPPTSCKTIDLNIGAGRAFLATLVYHNPDIAPVATPGERRIYSTNAAGDTLKSVIYLRGDGTIEINGDSDNLVTWKDLSALLASYWALYNGHKHGGSGTDSPVSFDITDARADTLKTDG